MAFVSVVLAHGEGMSSSSTMFSVVQGFATVVNLDGCRAVCKA